jgi:hypothetical protein
MAMSTVDATRPVTGGVGIHLDVNIAAAIDPIGGLLDDEMTRAPLATD